MRRTFVVMSMMLLGIGCPSADAAEPTVDDIRWLSGCWRMIGGEPGSGETWTAAAGGTLFGISRTIKNGRTVAHEFMQIRSGTSGKLAFIAQPAGQPAAEFVLVRLAQTEVVFENLTHDFPQRVIYRRDGARLAGRIEGTVSGQARSADFPMEAVRCASASSED